MGVDIWRVKYNLPGAKVNLHFESFQLLQNNFLKGFLFEEVIYKPHLALKITTLRNQILNAVNFKEIKCENFEISEIENMIILVFGIDLAMSLNSRISNSNQLIATYHPAQLLENPNLKQKVWNDIKCLSNR